MDSATAKLSQFSTIESVAHWLWEFSGRVHRKMENVRTREQIVALLDAEPEPSAATIRTIESAIRFAPYLLNRLMTKIAKDAAKKGLPQNPPGPKPVIPESTKPLIIAFILDLLGKRVSRQDAQKRAAARWGVSLRSIERLWAEDDRLHEPKMSIDDTQDAAIEWWNSCP
jgi:hypothetical protein